MSRGSRFGATVLVGALVLGAGCADDDDDGTAGVTTATGELGSTTVADEVPTTVADEGSTTVADEGSTTSQAAPLGGDPYKIVVITNESPSLGVRIPGLHVGIDAGVAFINENGGLGDSGRPVEATVCLAELDANLATGCARDAVADPDVIAVVAASGGFGDLINPILEEGGLASVGPLALTPSDMESPIAFPVMGGFAALACEVSLLTDVANARSIGVLYPNIPGGEAALELVDMIAGARSAEVAGSAAVDTGRPDVSAEATAATDGADGIVLFTLPEETKQLIRTVRQLTPDVDIAVSGVGEATSPASLEVIGEASEGLYIASFFATDDMPGEGVEQLRAAVERVGGTEVADDHTKNAWVGLGLLDFAAEGLTTIDRATILQALNGVSNYDSGGLTPVINFADPAPLDFLPRIANPTCVYSRVEGGEVVSVNGEFVNPVAPPGS